MKKVIAAMLGLIVVFLVVYNYKAFSDAVTALGNSAGGTIRKLQGGL